MQLTPRSATCQILMYCLSCPLSIFLLLGWDASPLEFGVPPLPTHPGCNLLVSIYTVIWVEAGNMCVKCKNDHRRAWFQIAWSVVQHTSHKVQLSWKFILHFLFEWEQLNVKMKCQLYIKSWCNQEHATVLCRCFLWMGNTGLLNQFLELF